MSKKKLDPSIIRVGDYVRIIKPDIFVRCGYPMSKKQAEKEVNNLFGKVIDDLVYSVGHGDMLLSSENNDRISLITQTLKESKCRREIISALSLKRLEYKGYGGDNRSIHTETKPEFANVKCKVVNIKYVQTGTYNGGYSGFSYDGEWDGYPPYLSNNKTHKILQVTEIDVNDIKCLSDDPWIEAINVEKLK